MRASCRAFKREQSNPKRVMQYQLALQFRGNALADYNAMIELEQLLSVLLGTTATVAGHDMAAGEKSIFIHTTNAPSTSSVAQAIPWRVCARLTWSGPSCVSGS
jgi:hypothetical protein